MPCQIFLRCLPWLITLNFSKLLLPTEPETETENECSRNYKKKTNFNREYITQIHGDSAPK